ncbi:MAG: nuclear transport factor 2 family protein, partial [Bdellovibrionota bacterium]
PETAAKFAREWVEAWNSHDLERILSHYSEDCVFSSPYIVQLMNDPSGTIRGKKGLREYWTKGLAAFPNLKFELLGAYAGVESVVVHYRSLHKGTLAAEEMTFGRDGKIVRGAAHYEVAGK